MTPPRKGSHPEKSDKAAREARLKAALKSNLARRKAQARARQDTDGKPRDGKD